MYVAGSGSHELCAAKANHKCQMDYIFQVLLVLITLLILCYSVELLCSIMLYVDLKHLYFYCYDIITIVFCWVLSSSVYASRSSSMLLPTSNMVIITILILLLSLLLSLSYINLNFNLHTYCLHVIYIASVSLHFYK